MVKNDRTANNGERYREKNAATPAGGEQEAESSDRQAQSQDVLRRMFAAAGVSKRYELADRLGVSASTITRWAKYGVTEDGLRLAAQKLGRSYEWLETGEEDSQRQVEYETAVDLLSIMDISPRILIETLEGGLRSRMPKSIHIELTGYELKDKAVTFSARIYQRSETYPTAHMEDGEPYDSHIVQDDPPPKFGRR